MKSEIENIEEREEKIKMGSMKSRAEVITDRDTEERKTVRTMRKETEKRDSDMIVRRWEL